MKILYIVALLAVLSIAGCSDDNILPPDPIEDEEQIGKLYLRFHLKLSGDGSGGGTRAETRADDQKPGTEMENAVKGIDLFVYDAETDVMVDHVNVSGQQIEIAMSSTGLVIPIQGHHRKRIRIHTVVNPTYAITVQYSNMTHVNDLSVKSDKPDYWDIMNDLIPGSDGKQSELENNKTVGIPMTGDCRQEGSTDNIITLTGTMTEENPLPVTATVSRIVAKVHVLAESSEHELSDGRRLEYVNAKDMSATVAMPDNPDVEDEPYANWIGWIRLDNVRYIPNGINRSTYIVPHFKSGIPADMNMDMTEYAINNRLIKILYDNDFLYYSGVDLHMANVSGAHFANAEKAYYKDGTKKNLDIDRYTRGMYCMENYFTIPDNPEVLLGNYFVKDYAMSIPIVTQVTVAARLTPRYIVVSELYQQLMDNLVDAYKANSTKFYNDYKLTPADFGQEDVKLWEETIKPRYFTNPKIPLELYRDDFYIIKAQSEGDAIHLIDWSLMSNGMWSGDVTDFENSKYPEATYFAYDTRFDEEGFVDDMWRQQYLYMTAGAWNKATDENINIKTYSVPQVGGWGYYFTYLDQRQPPANEVPYQDKYKYSQVTRNTYYIINIQNISGPGGSISRPLYLKTNTVQVNWTYDGRGGFDLR